MTAASFLLTAFLACLLALFTTMVVIVVVGAYLLRQAAAAPTGAELQRLHGAADGLPGETTGSISGPLASLRRSLDPTAPPARRRGCSVCQWIRGRFSDTV